MGGDVVAAAAVMDCELGAEVEVGCVFSEGSADVLVLDQVAETAVCAVAVGCAHEAVVMGLLQSAPLAPDVRPEDGDNNAHVFAHARGHL